MGLSAQSVGEQVRNAFEGAIALKQQAGKNEVSVRVSLPIEERNSIATFEHFVVKNAAGQEFELSEVVTIEDHLSDSVIEHSDGKRNQTLTANVSPSSMTGLVMTAIEEEVMPSLKERFPNVQWEFGGRQSDILDNISVMKKGLLFSILGIYIALAVSFKSYVQPLMVMLVIPFALVGAVLGHQMLGYSLSLISLFGMVALSGVVVNNALILIDCINRLRTQGYPLYEGVLEGVLRRFRPIMLTSVTTFVGLLPMLFERSQQARALMPVTISLSFGILFATIASLVVIPLFYLMFNACVKPKEEKVSETPTGI